MTIPSRRSYGVKRVRDLCEDFQSCQDAKDTSGHALNILLEMIDVQRGLARLDRGERVIILLCGIAGLTVREVGEILDRDHSVIVRRYSKALEKLTTYMNGEA